MEKFFRNTVLVLFVVFVSSTQIFSQWVEQTSPTSVPLRSIRAVNDNVVWACGVNGVVLKTTNGGANWVLCTPTQSSVTNHCIDALDASTAWVTGTVAYDGTGVKIWKTTDGGSTWAIQYSTSAGFGRGVRLFNSTAGVFYGDPEPLSSGNWEIFTTPNGGTNWNKVPVANFPAADNAKEEYGIANSLEIFGDNVWFSTFFEKTKTNPIHVYKSTNKGLNWVSPSYSVTLPSGPAFATLAFSNALNGAIATSMGDIGFTTNGGANWTLSTIGVPFNGITNVPGRNTFFAIGNPGVCYYSENGGRSWTSLNTNYGYKLRCIDATANYAWAAGDEGGILRLQLVPIANIKIFLQGCYNNGSMLTTLRDGGYLPLSQPYNTAPWSYTGPETVNTTIPSRVVDWVLVELRSGLAANTTIAQRAAFLKSDRSIVDLDGTSPLGFNGLSNGSYYIVVKHRNHLAIMSLNAQTFSSGNVTNYDFTTAQNQAYGSTPMKDLGGSKFGMVAGDANASGIVTNSDKDEIINNLNRAGYYRGDTNLSGIVTNSDKDLIITNLNRSSSLP